MAASLSAKPSSSQATAQRQISGIKFDLFLIFLTSWFIGGVHLDGWAHAHIPQLESFFTPWHAALYSGYLACAIAIVGAVAINCQRGYNWREAIPTGYELSLLGVPLFLIGGVADMIWHILFGIEKSTDALLSPTHLLLALSGVMIVSGPFRAAWHRPDKKLKSSWATLFPMIMSFIAIYSFFTFFTEYAHPFVHVKLVTQASTNAQQTLGLAGILLQSGIMMGFLLILVKRWQLPFGALTLILTVNTALTCVFSDQYRLLPAAFISGLMADLLIRFLNPSLQRLNALRVFAFFTPMTFYLCYFIELIALDGITWSIHFCLGSCVLAGIVGLVLSHLATPLPPQLMPQKEGQD